MLELAERITMYSTEAWGKLSKEANFSKFQIQRNVPGDDDVQFEVGQDTKCNFFGPSSF